MIRNVKKSDGTVQPFDPSRLNRWAEWAANYGVDWAEIAVDAVKRCHDGCTTSDLQWAMIEACIDRQTQAHANMAGRLLIGNVYKEAFGGFRKIPTLTDFYDKMRTLNLWEDMGYSESELDYLGLQINHYKDLNYGYAVVKQFRDKYAIKDALTKRVYESPQFMFMGMALAVMQNQPKDRRIQDVIKLYEYLSDLKINAPTPYLNGLRSKKSGYASCCVIKGDDTAESIGIAEHIAYTMTCKQAGIGILLQTRSKGDGVRNKTIVHQGKTPYFACINTAVKANKQQTRGGSATVGYTILDPEIDDLLRLNNPVTPPQKQLKFMDYQVGINESFLRRVDKDDEWMLVSFKDAPELHKRMYGSYELFEVEYDRVMRNPDIKKKMVSARKLSKVFLKNRYETGRVYPFFTDNMNTHTPFEDTIWNSNLCMEICLPTKGFKSMAELYNPSVKVEGEIALCFLSSIVAGRVKPEEYEEVAYYTLLMIDNVMDIMEYPYEALKKSAQYRRSVGVGITNLAHYLASNFTNYSSPKGKRMMHNLAELHSYSLHRASLRLAKERGVCEGMEVSKYRNGWTPLEDYSQEVDNIVDSTLQFDWLQLHKDIKANGGIRHSVLEAFMPNESSSLATNTTNGLYPVRELKMFKKSPQGSVFFLAPDSEVIGDVYQSAWDVPEKDMIECYAIFQKFTGQAISADFYMDYHKTGNKVSAKTALKSLIYAHRLGMKTQYYMNSRVGVGESSLKEMACEGCSL